MIQVMDGLKKIIESTYADEKVREIFLDRFTKGKFTRDEDPESHFCAYFAAFDPGISEVFMGHHKKSDLWLFNGGHIDEGEDLHYTVEREMKEEWGEEVIISNNLGPKLLTYVDIERRSVTLDGSVPAVQTCKRHHDIWFFIEVDKQTFNPDPSLLQQEFYETRWLNQSEADRLVKDASNIEALDLMFKRKTD